MGQPGMRVTLDAAMRAREVSRPHPDGQEPPPPSRKAATPDSGPGKAEPGKRSRAAKNERRRQGKRGGASGKPGPPPGRT